MNYQNEITSEITLLKPKKLQRPQFVTKPFLRIGDEFNPDFDVVNAKCSSQCTSLCSSKEGPCGGAYSLPCDRL